MADRQYRDQSSEPLELDRPAPDPKRRPGKWTTLVALMSVAALVGFAAVVVYAYNKGKEVGGSAVPPVITAGPAPHKIRPVRPGGMEIPNRDMAVYDRLDPERQAAQARRAKKVERLLAPPVTPVTPPAAAPSPKAETKPRPVAGLPPLPAPKPKIPVLPRGAKQAAQAAAPVPAPVPAPVRVASAGSAAELAAARLARIAPQAGGNFRLQLVSLRSAVAVKRAWARARRAHAKELGGLRLTVERKDLGAGRGVYYRLQVGPLGNAGAARALCGRLKRRGQGCIVVRR